MRELTIDIDSRIQYIDCKPGDVEGLLNIEFESNGVQIGHSVKWDSINRTEFQALANMKSFIAECS